MYIVFFESILIRGDLMKSKIIIMISSFLLPSMSNAMQQEMQDNKVFYMVKNSNNNEDYVRTNNGSSKMRGLNDRDYCLVTSSRLAEKLIKLANCIKSREYQVDNADAQNLASIYRYKNIPMNTEKQESQNVTDILTLMQELSLGFDSYLDNEIQLLARGLIGINSLEQFRSQQNYVGRLNLKPELEQRIATEIIKMIEPSILKRVNANEQDRAKRYLSTINSLQIALLLQYLLTYQQNDVSIICLGSLFQLYETLDASIKCALIDFRSGPYSYWE